MADEWQFQINDGPWHNIGDGQSYSAPVTPYTHMMKITHRIKPKRTDAEIVAKLRVEYGTEPLPNVTGLIDLGLDHLQALLRGDF